MDKLQHQTMVKGSVKQQFGRKKSIVGKTIPYYPYSPEREYQRFVKAYLKLLSQELHKSLPSLMSRYKKGLQATTRYDDASNLRKAVTDEFADISSRLEKKLEVLELEKSLEKISKATKDAAYREWKRVVKKTLSVNLMDDYYNGDFYLQMLQQWVSENLRRIKSIPTETLNELENVIFEGYSNGVTVEKLKQVLQSKYDISKQHALVIARDQIASLNANMSKLQQTDAGVKRYRWSTAKDQRVRACHDELDGKIFSWDDPPEMWYETKSQGVVYTGRCCHPGEDICCRCVAIPVFDYETVDVPIDGDPPQ